MAEIANPNANAPFERIDTDQSGEPLYGYRGQEIVHIPTNTSNMRYWQPEVVMSPEGCDHDLQIVDVGKRELECSMCGWSTTFHPGINYSEPDGVPTFTFRNTQYKLRL